MEALKPKHNPPSPKKKRGGPVPRNYAECITDDEPFAKICATQEAKQAKQEEQKRKKAAREEKKKLAMKRKGKDDDEYLPPASQRRKWFCI